MNACSVNKIINYMYMYVFYLQMYMCVHVCLIIINSFYTAFVHSICDNYKFLYIHDVSYWSFCEWKHCEIDSDDF